MKVTHERLHNLRCAAASVEFKTNKGRVFTYCPRKTATKWKRWYLDNQRLEVIHLIILLVSRLPCVLILARRLLV